jgi:hypothetical protein
MDIRTIRGIGPATEAALAGLGITDLSSLAKAKAQRLAVRLPVRGVTAEQVQDWIDEAKSLAGRNPVEPLNRAESYVIGLTVTANGDVAHTAMHHARTGQDAATSGFDVGAVERFIGTTAGLRGAEAKPSSAEGGATVTTAAGASLDLGLRLVDQHVELSSDDAAFRAKVAATPVQVSLFARPLGSNKWLHLGRQKYDPKTTASMRFALPQPAGVFRLKAEIASHVS